MNIAAGNEKTRVAPPVKCTQPTRLIGVQEETPLGWSPDGNNFLFTSENHSIFVCSFREEKAGEVSG